MTKSNGWKGIGIGMSVLGIAVGIVMAIVISPMQSDIDTLEADKVDTLVFELMDQRITEMKQDNKEAHTEIKNSVNKILDILREE